MRSCAAFSACSWTSTVWTSRYGAAGWRAARSLISASASPSRGWDSNGCRRPNRPVMSSRSSDCMTVPPALSVQRAPSTWLSALLASRVQAQAIPTVRSRLRRPDDRIRRQARLDLVQPARLTHVARAKPRRQNRRARPFMKSPCRIAPARVSTARRACDRRRGPPMQLSKLAIRPLGATSVPDRHDVQHRLRHRQRAGHRSSSTRDPAEPVDQFIGNIRHRLKALAMAAERPAIPKWVHAALPLDSQSNRRIRPSRRRRRAVPGV